MPLIAQLSDLHLTGKVGHDPSYHAFSACLKLALRHRPDLLVLTGDLVNDGLTLGYDWLFDTLAQTGIGFVCLAGNHDVTHEHNTHLPFHERTFNPLNPDGRLSDRLAIQLDNWQLLLMSSAVAGQIHGTICNDTLDWLHNTLVSNTLPTLIALHHHPLAIGSAWIDAHKISNASMLWQILRCHTHAKVIICGHVHQAHVLHHAHTTVLTTPAISRQFMPFCDEFMIDDIPSGIRLIWLGDDIKSEVVRCLPDPVLSSSVDGNPHLRRQVKTTAHNNTELGPCNLSKQPPFTAKFAKGRSMTNNNRGSFSNFAPYQTTKNEEYMSEGQLQHFKAILIKWRSDLLNEAERTKSYISDETTTMPDINDRATQEEEFALALRTRDRERKLVRKIDSSLADIKSGDYGYCQTCGVEIGIRRLEARPTATECIDCKTLSEIKEKQAHGHY